MRPVTRHQIKCVFHRGDAGPVASRLTATGSSCTPTARSGALILAAALAAPLTFIFSAPHAATSSASDSERGILAISPDICIRGDANSRCHIDLKIHVSLPDNQGFCIVAPQISYRHCLEQGGQTTELRHVKISEGLEIRVESLDGREILARRELSIADFFPTHPQPKTNLGWILM